MYDTDHLGITKSGRSNVDGQPGIGIGREIRNFARECEVNGCGQRLLCGQVKHLVTGGFSGEAFRFGRQAVYFEILLP